MIHEIKKGRYIIKLSNTNKLLLPPKITKGDIISYYEYIAPIMVPYLKNHALMMHRFPEGLSGESFYQKDASSYFPEWIAQAKIPKEGGYNNFVVCQNAATLIYLANQACITPHLWLSRIDKLHFPDRLIFDLDPSGDDFSEIQFMALALKEIFDHLGLISFAMTTGSRGIHVTVPLDRKLDFHAVKDFAHNCALELVHAFPTKATLEIRKEKRGTKVFIDTLRNQYGATSVAPYAIRAKPGAPVATPLHWEEVHDKSLTAQKFTIATIARRLETKENPWKDFLKTGQSLKKALLVIKSRGAF